jgi:hypothetical protein
MRMARRAGISSPDCGPGLSANQSVSRQALAVSKAIDIHLAEEYTSRSRFTQSFHAHHPSFIVFERPDSRKDPKFGFYSRPIKGRMIKEGQPV